MRSGVGASAIIKQERWKTAEVQRLLEMRFLGGPEAQQFAAARCRRDKQQAWERVSQRLRAELPLPSGDARSPAQCEQKLKNLRKEFLRLRTEQQKRSGSEGTGTLRLPTYWRLLEETLGHSVSEMMAVDTSPSAGSKARALSPTHGSTGGQQQRQDAGSCKGGNKLRVATGKRRRGELTSSQGRTNARSEPERDVDASSQDSTVAPKPTAAETEPALPPHRRPRGPSAQILQSVNKLNKLVAEFVASDTEAAARVDTERRLAKVESDVAQLRASVKEMADKMELVLAFIGERSSSTSTVSSNQRED